MEKVLPTHIIAAAGVVTNENGEILLVKDNRHGWVLPGGMVENGENVIDGVKREILEESGITVNVGELFCVSSNTNSYPGYNGVKEVPTKIMLDFVCKATGGDIRGSDENSESGWFPKDTVQDIITFPVIAERFRAYLEYKGRPTFLEYVTKPEFVLKLKRLI